MIIHSRTYVEAKIFSVFFTSVITTIAITGIQSIGTYGVANAQGIPSRHIEIGPQAPMGHCFLTHATLILERGNGIVGWIATVGSTGGGDSWGIKGLTLKDRNGTPLFTFPDFWSPTLNHNTITWEKDDLHYPVNLNINDVASLSWTNHC